MDDYKVLDTVLKTLYINATTIKDDRKIRLMEVEMDRAKLTQKIITLQEQIGRAMARYTPDAWMDLGLTISQLRALFLIDFDGSTNTERLASSLGVTRSNVSATVDHLIRQELVSRERHPDDHRIVLLKTTNKGEALVAKLRDSQMTRMSGILAKLSSEELSAMAKHLTILTKAVEVQKEGKQVKKRP